MDKSRDLFMHELGDILYAERMLVKTLPKLAEEATDSQLVAALEKHLAETEGHVENVEAAFEALGEQPKAEKCPGIDQEGARPVRLRRESEPGRLGHVPHRCSGTHRAL